MSEYKLQTDITALVAELKQCGKKKDVQRGKLLHSHATHSHLVNNLYISNTLISMYSKCGDVHQARQVFNSMTRRTVVSWTALIDGYVENGQPTQALDLFNTMDLLADRVTFVAALKACTRLAAEHKLNREECIRKGMAVHKRARERGLEKDVVVASTLVDMYSKFGEMLQARGVFDGMTDRDVVSWTALIVGYVENGECSVALHVFECMDCAPNQFTFAALAKACTALITGEKVARKIYIEKGREFHRLAVELGFHKDLVVSNAFMDMYCKSGDMSLARDVFDGMIHRDAISWNVILLGYVENGESSVALKLFNSMSSKPNPVTFVAALKACTYLAAEDKVRCFETGERIHLQARELGFDRDIFVSNTLVDMYCKCGKMKLAREVFDGMKHRDVVSWTALIVGYVEKGRSSLALEVFDTMSCSRNQVTFAAALKACGSLGASKLGERIHDRVCKRGWELDEPVATCLVDFYGKCGKMEAAECVFNRMHSRDTVTWNSLIGGYSSLGDTSRVLSLVKRMEESGARLDRVTVLLILSACSHAGLVDEGRRYFEGMERYGVKVDVEHYACMVDILGRNNRLEEALVLIRGMSLRVSSSVWMALLGACKRWCNVEVGRVAFDSLVALESKGECAAAGYVLMGSIYQKLGMRWEEEQLVECQNKKKALKIPGKSHWYDRKGRMHVFYILV